MHYNKSGEQRCPKCKGTGNSEVRYSCVFQDSFVPRFCHRQPHGFVPRGPPFTFQNKNEAILASMLTNIGSRHQRLTAWQQNSVFIGKHKETGEYRLFEDLWTTQNLICWKAHGLQNGSIVLRPQDKLVLGTFRQMSPTTQARYILEGGYLDYEFIQGETDKFWDFLFGACDGKAAIRIARKRIAERQSRKPVKRAA